jgi:TolA-binding protein
MSEFFFLQRGALMRRLPIMFGLVALGLAWLVSAGATQDAKKDKGEKLIKGSVPLGWTKALKLSKEQSKLIQKTDVEYKTKIAELTKKIDELKEQSRIEMTKHLTLEQKTSLARLSGLDVKDKDKGKDKEKEKEKEKK